MATDTLGMALPSFIVPPRTRLERFFEAFAVLAPLELALDVRRASMATALEEQVFGDAEVGSARVVSARRLGPPTEWID